MPSIKWSSFIIGAVVAFLLLYLMNGKRRKVAG